MKFADNFTDDVLAYLRTQDDPQSKMPSLYSPEQVRKAIIHVFSKPKDDSPSDSIHSGNGTHFISD